jgi:hypothetical protein
MDYSYWCSQKNSEVNLNDGKISDLVLIPCRKAEWVMWRGGECTHNRKDNSSQTPFRFRYEHRLCPPLCECPVSAYLPKVIRASPLLFQSDQNCWFWRIIRLLSGLFLLFRLWDCSLSCTSYSWQFILQSPPERDGETNLENFANKDTSDENYME